MWKRLEKETFVFLRWHRCPLKLNHADCCWCMMESCFVVSAASGYLFSKILSKSLFQLLCGFIVVQLLLSPQVSLKDTFLFSWQLHFPSNQEFWEGEWIIRLLSVWKSMKRSIHYLFWNLRWKVCQMTKADYVFLHENKNTASHN